MSDPTGPVDSTPPVQTNEESPQTHQDDTQDSQQQEDSLLVARYGLMRHTGLFHHNLESPPSPGTNVVAMTDRGVELAEIVANIRDGTRHGSISCERLETFLDNSGEGYPFTRGGKLLRLANPQDIIDQRHLESSAREERAHCRKQIRELGLNMKLICAEHLLGGERIIFYFTAESRVDFRELVRHLAAQYRTRIEMRQVGARDEARLVGDYERCGRRCCCQQFLKYLKPISMRMAKIQKATLDPSKISGRCGRLMCCLRYEDASYEELRSKLPIRNTWVRTGELVGRVVETHILTQLVKLTLRDGTHAVVSNEEIIDRDVPEPGSPEEAAAMEAARVSSPPTTRPTDRQEDKHKIEEAATEEPISADTPPESAEVSEAPSEGKPPIKEAQVAAPKKKKRRRQHRHPKRSSRKGTVTKGQPSAQAGKQPSSPQRAGGARKRSKRRKKKTR